MKVSFIWGAGGVGKSHVSIKLAANSSAKSLLLTLDPSQRAFHLLNLKPQDNPIQVSLENINFYISGLNSLRLFEELDRLKPSQPKVRHLYSEMAKGLQEFKNYLYLIQIGDELRRSEFTEVWIDTPPLQEAIGLHRAMTQLHQFFEKSLVQWALRSAQSPLLHRSIKALFDFMKGFSGKMAAQNLFEFIEWLSSHADRFSESARFLDRILKDSSTRHYLILSPESSPAMLDLFQETWGSSSTPQIIMNRSVTHYHWPQRHSPLIQELEDRKNDEIHILSRLQQFNPHLKIEKIPLLFMGDDSAEEMLRFIKTSFSSKVL